MPSYNLAIVGMGNVARALLRLLISKESDLRRQLRHTLAAHGSGDAPDRVDR